MWTNIYVQKKVSANFRFESNYEKNQIFPKDLEDVLKTCKMHHGLSQLSQQAGIDWLYKASPTAIT